MLQISRCLNLVASRIPTKTLKTVTAGDADCLQDAELEILNLKSLSYREVEQTIIYSKKPKMRACDFLSKVPFASSQETRLVGEL